MRTATGLMAGPDMPPVLLASTKLRLWMSIFMPVRVLIRDSASAPPASAARAISVMSVTLGVSFMMTGCFATRFTASVTFCTIAGSWPKAFPPSWTFGQEILISSISTGWSARRSVTSM